MTFFVAAVVSAAGMPIPSTRPTIRTTLLGGSQVEALYDTGACVTMIDEREFRNIPVNIRPQKDVYAPWLTLEGADKQLMQVKGCYAMPITVADRKIMHFFYVVKNLSSPVILGIDFINQHSLAYDPTVQEVKFVRDWDSAAATVAQKTTVDPQSSVKIPISAQVFPFNGQKVKGPLVTACSVDCTQSPIFGKDQIVQFDSFGNSHILIDNPLDVPVVLN